MKTIESHATVIINQKENTHFQMYLAKLKSYQPKIELILAHKPKSITSREKITSDHRVKYQVRLQNRSIRWISRENIPSQTNPSSEYIESTYWSRPLSKTRKRNEKKGGKTRKRKV